MKKIILDTNFLMFVGKIDILSELDRICQFRYELAVVDKTIKELEKIQGKLAIDFIKKNNVSIIRAPGKYADDEIVNAANSHTIVATQDKGLKKRLKVPLIVVRQKKYLEIEGL